MILSREAHLARGERQKAALGRTLRLFAIAAAVAIGLRSFVYQPVNIPSESMLPQLLVGDYLLVAKWPYGIGRYSLPLGLPLFTGRIGGSLPARGDIIVFKTPRDNRTDYIRRVIGLPGDRVAMVHGRVVLNGTALPVARSADFVAPATEIGCDSRPGRPNFRGRDAMGNPVCHYPALAETLPDGRRITVLDQVVDDVRDNTDTVTVPAGHVFVLGDNRDDSADSRFAIAEGGVGMVPVANIIGRADRIFFSIGRGSGLAGLDGWRRRLRLDRIGQAL